MKPTPGRKPLDETGTRDSRASLRYAVLTVALFVPLLFAFVFLRNVYPFAASTMMLGDGDRQSGREYYVLRGETVSGDTIDLPPITLTNALTGRTWSLVNAAIENKSFKIPAPHPANGAMASTLGGVDKLPKGERLEELLRVWGTIYNSRLPDTSNRRLKIIRLDVFRWEGGINGDYHRFVESWRAAL